MGGLRHRCRGIGLGPAAPRNLERDSAQSPRRNQPTSTLTLDLQNQERKHSCGFHCPVCGHLLQSPQEADRERSGGGPTFPSANVEMEGTHSPPKDVRREIKLKWGNLRPREGKGPRQAHTTKQGRHSPSTQLATLPKGPSMAHGAIGPTQLLLSVFLLNKLHL